MTSAYTYATFAIDTLLYDIGKYLLPDFRYLNRMRKSVRAAALQLVVFYNRHMTNKKLPTTIDDYISTFPADIQALLEKVRQAIQKAAPEAVETMSYGIPTFDLNGKHLVFFAGWKQHISLYPLPAGDEAFQQEIAQYKRARGTIQFRLDKPIPYELVEQIVTLLMKEKPEKEG